MLLLVLGCLIDNERRQLSCCVTSNRCKFGWKKRPFLTAKKNYRHSYENSAGNWLNASPPTFLRLYSGVKNYPKVSALPCSFPSFSIFFIVGKTMTDERVTLKEVADYLKLTAKPVIVCSLKGSRPDSK